MPRCRPSGTPYQSDCPPASEDSRAFHIRPAAVSYRMRMVYICWNICMDWLSCGNIRQPICPFPSPGISLRPVPHYGCAASGVPGYTAWYTGLYNTHMMCFLHEKIRMFGCPCRAAADTGYKRTEVSRLSPILPSASGSRRVSILD